MPDHVQEPQGRSAEEEHGYVMVKVLPGVSEVKRALRAFVQGPGGFRGKTAVQPAAANPEAAHACRFL